jgi:hypothetical protein
MFAVVASDCQQLWQRNGPLTDPDVRLDLVRLLCKKSVVFSRNLKEEDVEKAIKNRITYANAKDHVIYPEEVQHMADVYAGSAGSKVRPADRKVHNEIRPFRSSIGYDNESVCRFVFMICMFSQIFEIV